MSLNKAILKGRLGGDPEVKNSVVNFSIATDDGYKDKDGNKVENTNWHRCTAFGKTGEIIAKWFKKGDEILVIGRIDYREYDGKYYTNIIVSEFDFVSSKQSEGQPKQDAKAPGTPFETVPTDDLNEPKDDLPF